LIKNNKQKLKPFIVGLVPIDTYIDSMSKLGTWKTQFELIAASTLFQVPIYVAARAETAFLTTEENTPQFQ